MPNLVREHALNGELFFHYPHTLLEMPSSSVRDGDFKLLKIYRKGQANELRLYNLANDIGETNNLATQMSEKTVELHLKLQGWLEKVDASLPYDIADAWNADISTQSTGWTVWETGMAPPEQPLVGWRASTDVNDLARETWGLNEGVARPNVVAIDRHQPFLPKHAFRFDGNGGMHHKFFQVSDPYYPNTYDNDHSATFEVWMRLDSLNGEQVILESGDDSSGLSLTLGDADNDGEYDELRFRILGDNGKTLTTTAEIDRFSNPTRDFVQITAVFNDHETGRYAEIYVNGALYERVEGVAGPNEHINWDGFDEAGLGNVGGWGLGGSGDSGDLPFAGNGLNGEVASVRFYNKALKANGVRSNYNEMLTDVAFEIVSTSGGLQRPQQRPASTNEGALESDDTVTVLHERRDVLDFDLHIDILPQGGQKYDSNSLGQAIDGILPANMTLASYLIHFDPLGDPAFAQDATGSVTFVRPIEGILFEQISLEQTDAMLGVLGEYTLGQRALDLASGDFLSLSDDLRTLILSLSAINDEIINLRILTKFVPGDFNGDGIVDHSDFEKWQEDFVSGEIIDADGDGDSDGADFLIWQRDFSAPVSIIADFNNDGFADENDLHKWQADFGHTDGSDADADGDSDGTDFLACQRHFNEHAPSDFNLDGKVDAADLVLREESPGKCLLLMRTAMASRVGRIS